MTNYLLPIYPGNATYQHVRIVGAGFTNNLWHKQTVKVNPPRPKCFAFMGKLYYQLPITNYQLPITYERKSLSMHGVRLSSTGSL